MFSAVCSAYLALGTIFLVLQASSSLNCFDMVTTAFKSMQLTKQAASHADTEGSKEEAHEGGQVPSQKQWHKEHGADDEEKLLLLPRDSTSERHLQNCDTAASENTPSSTKADHFAIADSLSLPSDEFNSD